jgi:hypothetical protein
MFTNVMPPVRRRIPILAANALFLFPSGRPKRASVTINMGNDKQPHAIVLGKEEIE